MTFVPGKVTQRGMSASYAMMPRLRAKREIDPVALEDMAAKGMTRREIAREIKMCYTQFCTKVSNSHSLSEAMKKGLGRREVV